MAVHIHDWLVADSEDEDALSQVQPANGLGALVSTTDHSTVVLNVTSLDSSAIQTAALTSDQRNTPPRGHRSPLPSADESLFTPPPPRGTDSAISYFTNVPSKSDMLLAMAPKPRPRPRVVMKKAASSGRRVEIANSSFSHISDPPGSATRRTNDSIRPATATSFGFSDAVDDAYSSFDIAERAKMRSRKSQAAKTTIRTPVQAEVIELTSDEDELILQPTKRQKKLMNPVPNPEVLTKPRPKPRLRVKPRVLLPGSPPPSHRAMHEPPAPSVQCTPSQPPTSTLPTVPPSTPPQARELTPISSSPPVATRKRRRVHSPIADDDDEMDIIGCSFTKGSPSSTVPPPFFAPASSSGPTDSGIEIPPIESHTGRGKKKQVASGKTGTQRRGQNKGKKGKRREIASTVDEMTENSQVITKEPSTPAAPHDPSFTEERYSPVVRNPKTIGGKQTATKKGKARVIEEEDEPVLPPKSHTTYVPPVDEEENQRSKENLPPDDLSPPRDPPQHTSTPAFQIRDSSVRPKSTPMSELIRRVNSQPSSPFPSASKTYSPLLKSSRTMLSRIAPLHPNRRTPPPPLPRPPPPKKSKKQLEMEERIEEELAETVDGWSCLTDEERKALRKARIDAELGYEE